MTSTMEHMGYTTGLSGRYCRPCKLEVRTEGRSLCAGFDQHLGTDGKGLAMRCWQCIGAKTATTNDERND